MTIRQSLWQFRKLLQRRNRRQRLKMFKLKSHLSLTLPFPPWDEQHQHLRLTADHCKAHPCCKQLCQLMPSATLKNVFVKHWTCQAAGKALCRNACHDCIHLFPSSKYMSLRQISCDTLCSKARFHGEYQISTLQRTQFAIMWAFKDSTFQQESNFFNRNLFLIWHLKF